MPFWNTFTWYWRWEELNIKVHRLFCLMPFSFPNGIFIFYLFYFTAITYKCPVSDCPYSTIRIPLLTAHSHRHAKPSHFCSKCGKGFKSRGGYTTHINLHVEEARFSTLFVCESQKCDFKTINPSSLEEHWKVCTFAQKPDPVLEIVVETSVPVPEPEEVS